VMFATQVSNLWVAVAFVGLAASAHQGFSSNLFTTVSDMFPRPAIASVVGLGGTAGALGAMALLTLTSRLFQGATTTAGNLGVFTTLFFIAGSAYLLALALMHALAPTLRPVEVAPSRSVILP
jgi:MFS transporter, ACS family, hexuronate transporter